MGTFVRWLGIETDTLTPQDLGKVLHEIFFEVIKLKKELSKEVGKKNLGSSMSYNPGYQDVMTQHFTKRSHPEEETSSSQSQIHETNSANKELANILQNSIGNKATTKRVWNESSKKKDNKETVVKEDET